MINTTAKSFWDSQIGRSVDGNKGSAKRMTNMVHMVLKFVIEIPRFLFFDPLSLILFTFTNKGDAFMESEKSPAYSGQVLKTLRNNKHWTVRDLSKHSGVSASAISTFEREIRQPQIDILRKLLAALDAPKMYIM